MIVRNGQVILDKTPTAEVVESGNVNPVSSNAVANFITVKTWTSSEYSTSEAKYKIFEDINKKRFVINAKYDHDANVIVGAYFNNNNQLRWKIISGSTSSGHNVIIEYVEMG